MLFLTYLACLKHKVIYQLQAINVGKHPQSRTRHKAAPAQAGVEVAGVLGTHYFGSELAVNEMRKQFFKICFYVFQCVNTLQELSSGYIS